MRYYVTLRGREIPVEVTRSASGGWRVESGGTELDVDAVATGATLSVRVDGRVFDLLLHAAPPALAFDLGRSRGVAGVETARSRASAVRRGAREVTHGAHVTAPMPGRVVRVLVQEGQEVTQGAPLVVVEAMKMENELRSPRAARVGEVLVKSGETVERGARLIVLV